MRKFIAESFNHMRSSIPETECVKGNDTFMRRSTIRGQKEKEKEKQQQKEKAFTPSIENNPDVED